MQALELAGATENQLNRFLQCGHNCSLYYSAKLDRMCVRGDFCKNRNCAPCANARSSLIRSNLVPFIKNRNVRFLTLTLKHKNRPLSTQITRAWRCLKNLRSTPEWKHNVLGGCCFMEVKRNPRTHTWHVHFHCLIEGQYWDQKEISRLWFEATGDSYIADIQRKGTAQQMAAYGAKYASKPISAGDMESAVEHAEAIISLGRRRLWLVSGTWRKHLKLLARGEDPKDWEFITTANSLFDRADAGDPLALRMITKLLNLEEQTPNVDSS
jgi:hypothetical protein